MDFPLRNGFDFATALRCAKACAASYELGPFPSHEPVPIVIQERHTDTQGFIQRYDNVNLIAFRGSTSLRDWLTDAQFRMTTADRGSENVRVHRGFWAAIQSVWDDIDKILIKDFDKPIIVTGHSLGGALAILCAWLLRNQGYRVESVYTFGQPRVGNKAFARNYDRSLRERTFRFIKGEDVVPRVPGWLLGYRHCGVRMFISSITDELEVHPSLWLMAASDLFGLCESWVIRKELSMLTHHGINRYLEHLVS
jgi:triacylglycerol lipase